MHRLLAVAAVAWLLAACADATAPGTGLQTELARPWVEVAPEEVDLDPAILDRAAIRASQLPRFRSLLVARRGKLAFERYFGGANPATLHDVRSVTKSVVSALVGIAAAEGTLPNLDASIGDYLDREYDLDAADRAVTIRHLLMMTSGFQWNENGGSDYNAWILSGGDHVQYLLDRAHTATPGSRWTYNSAAVHALGVILERATGMSLAAFAEDRLFRPAGIVGARWESLGSGRVNGGSGIDMRGQDLLRLGQLFLQLGASGERALVPEIWVRGSTASSSALHTTLGPLTNVSYGYLWWTADGGAGDAYFAWGYGGQFIYIVPSLELVAVATTEWRELSAEGGPRALEETVMRVIVNDVVAAAR
jgi:CubicO group peptidase (beta-lactamase class C family)